MSDKSATVNRTKAVDIIAALSAGAELSQEDRTMLEDAVEQDLDATSHDAAHDEDRLKKLEGQVHALSDAVIAIGEPSDAVDGAVQRVKDKM